MCTYESNLSFEELKLELKPEHWLKTDKIEIWGDTYLSLLRAKISKLKNYQGNWLHLGERVPKILRLDIEPTPWISLNSEITRFENRMISLKIDLKWPQNG